jgi:hypothetical protein
MDPVNPSTPDTDPTTLIKTHYTSHIRSQSASSDSHNKAVASAFGYTPHDLASIPSTSNLGVSCGNPLARAGLREVCSLIAFIISTREERSLKNYPIRTSDMPCGAGGVLNHKAEASDAQHR